MGYEFIIHSLWCLIHPCAAAAAPLVFPQPWTQLYYSLRTCLPSKTGQPFLELPCLSTGITCSPELGSLWLDEGFSGGRPPLLGGHLWSLLGGQSARSSSFHTHGSAFTFCPFPGDHTKPRVQDNCLPLSPVFQGWPPLLFQVCSCLLSKCDIWTLPSLVCFLDQPSCSMTPLPSITSCIWRPPGIFLRTFLQ